MNTLARVAGIILWCLATCVCGGSPPAPPDTGGDSGGAVTINGSERLGWVQAAPGVAAAASYAYTIYVDGAGAPLGGVECVSATPEGVECAARLPRMSAGRHVLELAAADNGLLSSRSGALIVTVMSSATANVSTPPGSAHSDTPEDADASSRDDSSFVCSADEQRCFSVTTIAAVDDDARRLVAIPDGRLFVISGEDLVSSIERDGRIASIALDGVCRRPYRSYLSNLAPSFEFERDRMVYAAWACEAQDLPMKLLIASYRELGDTLGEAQVLETMTIDDRNVEISPGPGARLHVAARTRASWGLISFALADGRIVQSRPRLTMTLPAATAIAATSEHLFVLANGALLRASRDSSPPERVFASQRSGFAASLLAAARPSRSALADGDVVWLASAGNIGRIAIPADLSDTRSRPILADLLDVRSIGQVRAIGAGMDGELFALTAPPANERDRAGRVIRFGQLDSMRTEMRSGVQQGH